MSLPSASGSTAILLAGGHSRRMGRPKAFLPFDGEPLLARLVRLYRGWFAEVVVAAAPGQELPPVDAPVVRDAVPDRGPLAGICAGLRAASRETCFVSSCDHPFPDLRLVEALVAGLGSFGICAPRWEQRLQPLFAAYRRSLALPCEAQLARGDLRPVHLFDRAETRILEPAEILALEPGGRSLMDVDEPAGYRHALALLASAPERAAKGRHR